MADSSRGGVGNWLVDLIMKPGTAVKLVPAINVVLVMILLILTGLAISGETSIHLFVLGFLSVGLMASVNWFISEYNKVKLQQEQQGSAPATTAGATKPEKED